MFRKLLGWIKPKEDQVVHRQRDEERLPIRMLDNHIVRAKKEYTCEVCHTPIFATQRMRRVVYKDQDRKFRCDRVHVRCYS